MDSRTPHSTPAPGTLLPASFEQQKMDTVNHGKIIIAKFKDYRMIDVCWYAIIRGPSS